MRLMPAGRLPVLSLPNLSVPLLSVLALAACQPTAPNDGGGQSYQSYLRQQTGNATAGSSYGASSANAATGEGGIPMTRPALGTAPDGAFDGGYAGSYAAGMGGQPTGISDENDFKAVSSRETIASDKARIAANAARYQQVQPTALPQRSGNGDPNIVAYALQSSNALGQPAWSRSRIHMSNWQNNCSHYASQDLAQIDFLKRGGPQRDPGNLDPDGDGYACYWDPTPFQKAR